MTSARAIIWSIARHGLLLAGAAFVLLPFVWMISTASKPQTEIFTSNVHFIPHSFALWDNLATAFGKATPLGSAMTGMRNSPVTPPSASDG